MPEGHVIHRLANELNDRFGGTVVRVSSPQGRFQLEADLLDGTELVEAFARGKHLFVGFAEDRYVYIHLGLIGKLQFYPPEGGPNPARMRIANDHSAADLTGPQFCELVSRGRVEEILAKSGPDPLDPDADPEVAWRKVHATSRPIAALLMDQSLFAGVGNIYRAEVLFRHRLDPHRPGKELRRSSFDAIWDDLVELMPLGVRDGRIDTVHLEHSPEVMGREPRVDRHGGEVYVYRRAGQPCLVCGSKVRTELLAGRNLYWCGRCQRRR